MERPVHLFLNNRFYKTIVVGEGCEDRWYEHALQPIQLVYEMADVAKTVPYKEVLFRFCHIVDRMNWLDQWIGNALENDVVIDNGRLVWNK